MLTFIGVVFTERKEMVCCSIHPEKYILSLKHCYALVELSIQVLCNTGCTLDFNSIQFIYLELLTM